MPEDFLSAWVKMDRSQAHLDALTDTLSTRLKHEQKRVSRHIEEGGRKHVYRFDGSTVVDLQWSATVGDILYNLRSALEHVAWQLVRAVPNRPDPTRNTFDIHLNVPRDRRGNVLPLYLDGKISSQTFNYIESIQPYHGRNDPLRDNLWLLHDLNRIDKHRHLLLNFLAYDRTTHALFDGYTITYFGRSLLVTGEPVGFFILDPPNPDLDLNPEFTFNIFMENVRPRSVIEALHDIFRTVPQIVEECERLDPNISVRRP